MINRTLQRYDNEEEYLKIQSNIWATIMTEGLKGLKDGKKVR